MRICGDRLLRVRRLRRLRRPHRLRRRQAALGSSPPPRHRAGLAEAGPAPGPGAPGSPRRGAGAALMLCFHMFLRSGLFKIRWMLIEF